MLRTSDKVKCAKYIRFSEILKLVKSLRTIHLGHLETFQICLEFFTR